MKINYLFRLVAVAATVLLLPGSASALVSLGLEAGVRDTESFDTGFDDGCRVELGSENLALFLRVGLTISGEFNSKQEIPDNCDTCLKRDTPLLSQYEFGGLVRSPEFSGFRFYGAGGGGYYTVQGWKTIDFELSGFDTDNDHIGMFGWWILGGVEYCFGRARGPSAIFLEAKYTEASETEGFRVYDESSHTERSGKMDVDLSGISVHLGIRGIF